MAKTGVDINQVYNTYVKGTEVYGVKSLALFGSVARDEAGPSSDIDMLVEFYRPAGLFGLFSLQDRLEELFGRKVDLGTLDSLKPRLRPSVMSELVYVPLEIGEAEIPFSV